MDHTKITVIVPVYNTAPYLSGCLDSLLVQTYENLEIICIDDGSTDESPAILANYSERDARIRVIRQPNRGAAMARNAGLDAASGEYIGFVDSDDWVEPDMYHYLLTLIEQHHADLAQCGLFLTYETIEVIAAAGIQDGSTKTDAMTEADWVLFSNQIWNKLFRRELLYGVHFDRDYTIGEDLLFNIEVMRHSSCLAFGAQAKYHYIQRDGSLCNAAPTLETLCSARRVFRQIEAQFCDNPIASAHFRREQLRNDLDICSKLVRFSIAGSTMIEREVRTEIISHLSAILRSDRFTGKEKLKFLLIARCWSFYSRCLPLWKRLVGKR